MPYEEIVKLIEGKRELKKTVEFYSEAEDKNELGKIKIDPQYIRSGNSEKLQKYLKDNCQNLSEYAISFLVHRVRMLNQFAEAEKKYSDKKSEPVKLIQNRDGSVILEGVVPDRKQDTQNGCWSCAYSLMLKSRGVKLDQKIIRAYHGDEEKEKTSGYEADIDKDVPFNPEDKADVLMKLVPNTALKSVKASIGKEDYEEVQSMQVGNQVLQFDQVKIKSGLREKIEKIYSEQIKNSIHKDKSPVGLLVGNHFYTIVGLTKNDDLLVYDSEDGNNKLMTKPLKDYLGLAMPKNRVVVSLVSLADITPKKNAEEVELSDDYKKFEMDTNGEVKPKADENTFVINDLYGSKSYLSAEPIELQGEENSSCSIYTYMPKVLNKSLLKKDIVVEPPKAEEQPIAEAQPNAEEPIPQAAPEQNVMDMLQQQEKPDEPALDRRPQSNREFRQLYEKMRADADEVIQAVRDSRIYKEADKQGYLEKLSEYKKKVDRFADCLERRLDSHDPETKETKQEMLDRSIDVRTALDGLRLVMPNQYAYATKTLDSLDGIITGINPQDKLSLETIARGTTSNVYAITGNPDYVTVGGDQRYMMKKINADGTEAEGYFAIDKKVLGVRHTEQVEKIVNEALEAGENNQTLKNFVAAVKKSKYGLDSIVYAMQTDSKIKESQEKAKRDLDENRITKMPKTLRGYEPKDFDRMGITKDGTELSTDQLKKDKDVMKLLDRVRNTYTDAEVSALRDEMTQYARESRMGIGAVKDSTRAGRSYATSKLAELLGVPDLVAKSRPMKASVNGEVCDGVFTEKASGTELPSDRVGLFMSDFNKIKGEPFVGDVLGKLAAIQVLDYICGNVDRNQQKMTYTIDTKNGKITDVKAIDNDMSFGTKTFDEDKAVQNGVKLSQLMVVPKEMVDTLNKVPVDTIMGALADTGLAENEIKAVGQRVTKLKEYIKTHTTNKEKPELGSIKVVDKEGWKNLKMDQLSKDTGRKKVNNSIFNTVSTIQKDIVAARIQHHKNENGFREILAERKKQLPEGGQIKRKLKVANNTSAYKAVDISEHVDKLKGFISDLSATETTIHRTTKIYDAMKSSLVSLSETKHPEKMGVDDYRAFEQSIADVEQATSDYIRHKMEKRDTWITGKTRLAKAQEVRDYLEDYRKQVHEAGNLKEEEQLQEDYNNFLEEQNTANRKLDIVTGALAKAIVGDKKVEDVKGLEEKIRADKDFRKLMSSRDGMFDKDKVSPIDYFGNMALENPEKLKALYESIKLGKDFVDNYAEPSKVFENKERTFSDIKSGLTEEKSSLYSKVVQHYAMKDKIKVDTKEDQLKFYKKWYDEVASKDKVSNYFEKESEAGMTDALYDRTLLKNLLQEEKQLRELYVNEGAAFDKYKNLRKICGLKQAVAQHATKMYDEKANVYERVAAKYAYESFMSKYKNKSYADIPTSELALQKSTMKLLTKHLEKNMDADKAADFLSGKASLDDKLKIGDMIEKYINSKKSMVESLTKEYDKFDAKLEAEANQRGRNAEMLADNGPKLVK